MSDPVKTPAITSANLPTPAPTATSVIDDDVTIVAKPLGSGFDSYFPVNPAISFRWINRVAGSGARFDQAKAQGFVPVVLTDIKNSDKVPKHVQRDGVIIDGDTILMKMSRLDYEGAKKMNEQNATRRLSHVNTLEQGRSKMSDALNEVQGSPANKSKIRLYNPNAGS